MRFSYHWHSGTCAANNAISTYGVRTALPADVSSGASVTNLSATIQAPPTAGTYCLQYDLVHELVTWFSWQGASVQSQTVTVSAPTYGVNWGTNTLPTTMSAGSGQSVTATFTNTGSLTWASGGPNPVRFGYHWHTGTCAAGNPISIYGVRTSLAADVAPGGAVTSLDASVQAPPTAGTYCLQYDLVRELVTWFSWQGATVQSQTVTVGAPLYSASWGANTLPTTLVAGDTTTSAASFTNSGSLNWQAGGANPVRFSYHWHAGTCAAGNAASIYGVRTLLPGDVAANGTVNNLSVSIQAPPTSGTYCLKYDLVRELVTWFSWQGAATQEQTVTVTPAYAVTWGANTLPTTLSAGATTQHLVTFTNNGLTWPATGGTPVRFSYHWHAGTCAAGSGVIAWGERTLLPGDVATGGTVTGLSATILAPGAPGTYCLQYDMVRELVTWFSWQGANVQSQTVTVNP